MDLATLINKIRLNNPNKWYTYVGMHDGKRIEIKGFNTWLQIFRVDGTQQITTMDCSVGEFKTIILGGLGYV